MIGIISGNAAALVASAKFQKPRRPEEITVDHQPEAELLDREQCDQRHRKRDCRVERGGSKSIPATSPDKRLVIAGRAHRNRLAGRTTQILVPSRVARNTR
jgi:hypothetical protein